MSNLGRFTDTWMYVLSSFTHQIRFLLVIHNAKENVCVIQQCVPLGGLRMFSLSCNVLGFQEVIKGNDVFNGICIPRR